MPRSSRIDLIGIVLIAPLMLSACSQSIVDGDTLSAETSGLSADQHFVAFQSALAEQDFVTAEIEAAHVVGLDPDRGSAVVTAFDEARSATANTLLARATTALQDGDQASAERHAARVLAEFGETDAAAAARKMFADVETEQEIEGAGGLQLASAKQSDKRLKDAERYVARGSKRSLKGLTATGSSASKSFESSASDYQKAISALDKVIADDDATAEQQLIAQQLREKAVAESVDVHLNVARFYMNRGSNKQAGEALDQARALDPSNLQTETLTKQVARIDEEWGKLKTVRRHGGKKWENRPPAE